MMLITPYAPTTFRRPCVIVSSVALESLKETVLLWVEALNIEHALVKVYGGQGPFGAVKMQQHESEEAAIKFHLELVAPFKNGGTDEEWGAGTALYRELYEKWCPDSMKETPRAQAGG